MIKLKISIALIIAIILIGIYGINAVFAQTTNTSSQLNSIVKSGVNEQKNNPEALKLEKEVTTGEIQSAGENKDTKEVQVPEVNVEKEIESESSKSSSTDKKSSDSSSKSSSHGN